MVAMRAGFVTIGAALAAFLAAGAANATIVTSISGSTLAGVDFQGAVVGSTYITFEDVAVGTSGAFTSGIASFSGNGAVEASTLPNHFAMPAGDKTHFLATSIDGKNGLETETATFAKSYTKFGLYWGSIDAYNTIVFKEGATTIFTLTGPGVPLAVAGGNQTSDLSNKFVNFDFEGKSFNTVVFETTRPSFEVDNLAVAGAIPELPTWAMMLAGFGLVGLQIRRRKSFAKNDVA
jgi:hypothetical protein